MNLITGQRTYFYAVSGTNPINVTLPFYDTSGNLLNCNYVEITATNGVLGGNGFLVAELRGVSKIGNMTLNNLAPATNVASINTSGICGLGITYGASVNGKARWHGSNGEVCTGVTIKSVPNTSGSSLVMLSITYGNLFSYNYLRSDLYDRGV